MATPWFVYLIECCDSSIYTGISTDVDARYAKHVAGSGARYTRSHPPLRLLASFEVADRSSASKAEYAIKQLDAQQKRALCLLRPIIPGHSNTKQDIPFVELHAAITALACR